MNQMENKNNNKKKNNNSSNSLVFQLMASDKNSSVKNGNARCQFQVETNLPQSLLPSDYFLNRCYESYDVTLPGRDWDVSIISLLFDTKKSDIKLKMIDLAT